MLYKVCFEMICIGTKSICHCFILILTMKRMENNMRFINDNVEMTQVKRTVPKISKEELWEKL